MEYASERHISLRGIKTTHLTTLASWKLQELQIESKKLSDTQAGDGLFGLMVYLFWIIWLFHFWESIIRIIFEKASKFQYSIIHTQL